MKIVFIGLGIGQTIVSRCLMTSMDYYHLRFSSPDLPFYTSVVMYSSTLLSGLLLVSFQSKLSIPLQLFGSLIGLIVTYAGCPLVASLFPDQPGMYVYYLMIFLNGGFKIMGYQSSVGYSQLFPKDSYNVYFITGTGISGVLAFVLRVISLLSFKELNYSLLMYFGFTLVVQVWVCIMVYRFYYSNYSQQHLSYLVIQPILSNSNIDSSTIGNNNNDNDDNDDDNDDNDDDSSNSNIRNVWLIVKRSYVNLLGIILTFFISYGLFPGLIQKKQYSLLDISWNTTLLAGNFEISDTIGKYLSIHQLFNKYVLNLLALTRLVFVYIFVHILHSEDGLWSEYWMIHLMVLLCAFTNGYCGSSNVKQVAMGLKSSVLMKQAGYVSILCIFIGTFSGSMFGLYLNTL